METATSGNALKSASSTFAHGGDRTVTCLLSKEITEVARISSYDAVTTFYALADDKQKDICTHKCKLACLQ